MRYLFLLVVVVLALVLSRVLFNAWYSGKFGKLPPGLQDTARARPGSEQAPPRESQLLEPRYK